jgi:hypothetical protein
MLTRVAEELKPPVAIRITRPYASEAEFLEREFDTLTHTSVILLGAQARPQGVVLRFEIVLTTGESMLRGEGRVVGYKERAYAGEPGLSLRFTRLDSRSKTLVDRASALREARVRASTSLMSMPAVVVPRPAPQAPPPIPSLESSPRLPTPVPRRASVAPPALPGAVPPAPPSRRMGPPALPGWAKLGPPPPVSIPIDVESTQVDAHFDLEPHATPEPVRAAASPAAPPVASPPSPVFEPAPVFDLPSPAIDLPAVESFAVRRPSAPPPPPTFPESSTLDSMGSTMNAPEATELAARPARAPIRPTPARPPPLPRSVPPIGRVAPAAATGSANTTSATAAVSPSRPSAPPPPSVVAANVARAANVASAASVSRVGESIARPAERDALLLRLRQRAGSLPRARVEEILAKRPAHQSSHD